MTPQEIFDRGLAHIRAQGEFARPQPKKKGQYAGNQCRYRSVMDDGRVFKCVIGGLIPDEIYSPEIEGMAIDMLVVGLSLTDVTARKPLPIHTWKWLRAEFKGRANLLMDMQEIHDLGTFDLFEPRMRTLAAVHDLVYNPPN